MEIQRLKNELKDSLILSEGLDQYGADATANLSHQPDLVVIPNSERDIPALLRYANELKVPITTRGAGTGVTGGAVPIQGGIVLSLERMNRILEIDCENRMAVVEPGVITAALQEAVLKKGLSYPPDPASLKKCTIGGNVAENAGGASALKYGVTGDYVVGLEGYFASGEPFKLGGKLHKNVAGYDLIRLLVGSEGTLGIITKIILRLKVPPKFKRMLVVEMPSLDCAVSLLSRVCQSNIQPAVAEYMDQFCLEAVAGYLNHPVFFANSPAAVIFQVDGSTEASVEADREAIETLTQEFEGSKTHRIDGNEDEVWTIRRSISLALKQQSYGVKISEDVVVPLSQIEAYLKAIREIGAQIGVKILGYGHLGDGNVHVNILKMDLSEEEWEEKQAQAVAAVIQTALDMGGSLTGEHGVGLTKKAFMTNSFSESEISLMKAIKNSADPKGILNPGKIFC